MRALSLIVLLVIVIPAGAVAKPAGMNVSIAELFPLAFKENSNRQSGILVDITNELSTETKLPLKSRIKPYKRTLKEASQGLTDLVYTTKNNNYPELIPISKVYDLRLTLLNKKSTVSYIHIENPKIGILRGSQVARANIKFKAAEIFEFNDYSQGIEMLLRDRFQYIIGSDLILHYHLSQTPKLKDLITFPGSIISSNEIWLFISGKSQHKDNIDVLREGLNTLKNKGVIMKICNSYAGSGWNK